MEIIHQTLCANKAASCCLEVAKFFGIVQSLFFSVSTKRWSVLLRHVSLTLKPLSTTRWEARIEAFKPLRYQLGNIDDALIDIFEDQSLTSAEGTKTLEARGSSRTRQKYIKLQIRGSNRNLI